MKLSFNKEITAIVDQYRIVNVQIYYNHIDVLKLNLCELFEKCISTYKMSSLIQTYIYKKATREF